MPQIAQQDYLKLEISDFGSLSTNEKQAIRDFRDKGVLFDVLIVGDNGDRICRIVADEIDNSDTVSVIYGGEVHTLDVGI